MGRGIRRIREGIEEKLAVRVKIPCFYVSIGWGKCEVHFTLMHYTVRPEHEKHIAI